jgi:membrane fusion protein (multidrug efflux system)
MLRINKNSIIIVMMMLAFSLYGCSKKNTDTQDQKNQGTLISTTIAQSESLEIREEALGTIEGLIDPTISAEAAGRVMKVLAHPGNMIKKGDELVLIDATDYNLQRKEAQSEVARLNALVANQGRIVERNLTLVQKNFISQHALEDVTTQQSALQQQLDGAKARLALIDHTKGKTRVLAPVDGIVQKQIVSTGDFVKIGDPLIQIISTQKLRAHLPLPENIAAKLKEGIKVRLSTPTSDTQIMSTVREFKPMISESSRAIDVIADINGEAGWQPGASVKGEIILGTHEEAVLVPEESVVLRPAGEVVYLIKDNTAIQKIVKTGLRQDGKVEILDGLNAGDIIAKDGAAFLTDQAKVIVDSNKQANQP